MNIIAKIILKVLIFLSVFFFVLMIIDLVLLTDGCVDILVVSPVDVSMVTLGLVSYLAAGDRLLFQIS